MMSPVPRAVLRPLSSILCFLSSVLCFTTGCSPRETAVAAGLRTQTLHVNNLAEPRDFDPQTANAQPDISIIRALMEGLTEVDPRNCQPIPGVAERWETSAIRPSKAGT